MRTSLGVTKKAVTYFDQAFPFGVEIFEQADPVGYSAIMKDDADALKISEKLNRLKLH